MSVDGMRSREKAPENTLVLGLLLRFDRLLWELQRSLGDGQVGPEALGHVLGHGRTGTRSLVESPDLRDSICRTTSEAGNLSGL